MATNNAINQVGVLPAFMYTNNADQTNVTGNSTIYTVQFADKIFDTTNSFSGTTFTAPLTGKYFFAFNFYLTGIDTSMTNNLIYLTTTGGTYRFMQESFAPGQALYGSYVTTYSLICPMTATDTASIQIRFIGSGQTVSIFGTTSSGFQTPLFSGYMISGI